MDISVYSVECWASDCGSYGASGLGRRFHTDVKASFKKLKMHPFFPVRYDNVHYFLLNKFPYMVHYTIDEEIKIIIVRAVFGTSKDSRIWKARKYNLYLSHQLPL